MLYSGTDTNACWPDISSTIPSPNRESPFRQLIRSLVINGGREPSRRENIASFFGDRETYHLLITSHTQLTERAWGPFRQWCMGGDEEVIGFVIARNQRFWRIWNSSPPHHPRNLQKNRDFFGGYEGDGEVMSFRFAKNWRPIIITKYPKLVSKYSLPTYVRVRFNVHT